MNKLILTLVASIMAVTVSAHHTDEQPTMTGLYILSGSGYCYQTGQYTMDAGSKQLEVKVYNDHITIKNLSMNYEEICKYAGKSGNTKCYRDWSGGIYYLRADGSMYYETQYRELTFMYEMTRVY